MGCEVPGLVATVGQLQVQPGAANVVPSLIELSLDIRHADDRLLATCVSQLCEKAQSICVKRGIELSWQTVLDSQTIPCSPRLIRRWQQALSEEGYPEFTMSSGAGHDGVVMSGLTEFAMLFVRCRGGISHNPAEAVLVEDVAAAIAVLDRYLQLTAKKESL
jgi:allantoate deiminase